MLVVYTVEYDVLKMKNREEVKKKILLLLYVFILLNIIDFTSILFLL